MSTVDAPPASSPGTAQKPDGTLANSRNPLPAWIRWLHLYGSMLGLGALLFFSLTGLTLNHPEWTFGLQRRELHFHGQLNAQWLAPGQDEKLVDKLKVAEALRKAHRLPGLVDDFRVDATEGTVAFKGPGSSADVVINRQTGAYELTETTEGLIALVNDLHKSRHTGPIWSAVIDGSALLLTVISLSGLWPLFYVVSGRNQ